MNITYSDIKQIRWLKFFPNTTNRINTLMTDGKTMNLVLVSVNQRPRKLPIKLISKKSPMAL